jgi:hypothetical protein
MFAKTLAVSLHFVRPRLYHYYKAPFLKLFLARGPHLDPFGRVCKLRMLNQCLAIRFRSTAVVQGFENVDGVPGRACKAPCPVFQSATVSFAKAVAVVERVSSESYGTMTKNTVILYGGYRQSVEQVLDTVRASSSHRQPTRTSDRPGQSLRGRLDVRSAVRLDDSRLLSIALIHASDVRFCSILNSLDDFVSQSYRCPAQVPACGLCRPVCLQLLGFGAPSVSLCKLSPHSCCTLLTSIQMLVVFLPCILNYVENGCKVQCIPTVSTSNLRLLRIQQQTGFRHTYPSLHTQALPGTRQSLEEICTMICFRPLRVSPYEVKSRRSQFALTSLDCKHSGASTK